MINFRTASLAAIFSLAFVSMPASAQEGNCSLLTGLRDPLTLAQLGLSESVTVPQLIAHLQQVKDENGQFAWPARHCDAGLAERVFRESNPWLRGDIIPVDTGVSVPAFPTEETSPPPAAEVAPLPEAPAAAAEATVLRTEVVQLQSQESNLVAEQQDLLRQIERLNALPRLTAQQHRSLLTLISSESGVNAQLTQVRTRLSQVEAALQALQTRLYGDGEQVQGDIPTLQADVAALKAWRAEADQAAEATEEAPATEEETPWWVVIGEYVLYIALLAVLFFGGRWIYRKVKTSKPAEPETSDTADETM